MSTPSQIGGGPPASRPGCAVRCPPSSILQSGLRRQSRRSNGGGLQRTRRGLRLAAILLAVTLAAASHVLAQLPTQGLPVGSGTARRGRPIYVEKCAACHGEKGEDPKYNLLAGGRGTLTTDKPVLTIGSFWPHAATLWSYINRSQPVDEPGSLTADEVYAVTAYLLHLNGIIGENDTVDAKTLPRVQMPNRDGFVLDPRPDVGEASKAR